MLADELDFVLGVVTHRDVHAVGVIEVRSGVVAFEASVTADSSGYADALRLAQRHAPGRRAFAIEGTASFGAGLTAFSSTTASRCSRSVGYGESAVQAARPTHSTQSEPLEACSPRRGQPGRGPQESEKRYAR